VRILLDECVNPRLRQAFPNHDVLTVAKAKWRALPDAKLIVQAQGQCDVLVTIDRGFEHEHNLKKLSFGIVIIHVLKNRMEYYIPLFPALLNAVERVKPGQVVHVSEISGLFL
jgi:predicted nuclease of predicted toxin-antitoxin system